MGVKVRVEIVGGPEDGKELIVDSLIKRIRLPEQVTPTPYNNSEEDPADVNAGTSSIVELPIRPTSNGLRVYWSERRKVSG